MTPPPPAGVPDPPDAAVRAGGGAAGAAARAWHAVSGTWRRSLQLRVVATTMVLSLVVSVLLGLVLLRQVSEGLLDAKTAAARADASAGIDSAQARLDAARDVEPGAVDQLLTQLVQELAFRGGGAAGLYEVVLLGQSGDEAPVPSRSDRASRDVSQRSVPGALRTAVLDQERIASTYTLIRYVDDRTVPGYVVGAPVNVPGTGSYELYYLFPLDQQQQTLDLVRRAVLSSAVLLAVLLAAVAWLVVRQVVTPVRMAAQIAERLAAGRLEERMAVRGQDDLARLARSFNEMAESLQQQIRKLEDLSRLQRRFVSDVSHELRTPLTTIRMAADVLHEGRGHFDPAVSRSAELLQTQLDRFEELLVDLLEISRFDAGAAVLDTEQVDVGDLVRRVADTYAPLAANKGSRLVLDLPGTPCTAEVDQRRIDRVLRNLVGNAIEHGEGRDVALRVAADQDAVAVAVRDRGVGLRPGDAAMVFNRFWRADPARARATGGTGLGLSIALEDVRLHAGWLQAWGEPGVGSQFRVTLPRTAGGVLRSSPIPLMPADVHLQTLESVGASYRRLASREGAGDASR